MNLFHCTVLNYHLYVTIFAQVWISVGPGSGHVQACVLKNNFLLGQNIHFLGFEARGCRSCP